MNPRLDKLKNKNLVYFLAVFFSLIILAGLIPALRVPALSILKYPLRLASLIKREVNGIIFYHRNFIRNELLQKEIGLLRQKLNTLNEAELENKRLSDLLSLKQRAPYKVLAAKVIGRSADNWASTVIIDQGHHSGIRRGMVVLGFAGLAGRVTEASSFISKVMLINDPDLAVSAMVQRSRWQGLVTGTLGNYLVMRYLPKDSDIQPADSIITSGLTETYPKGLCIGEVLETGEEFSGLSRYAIIRPAVELAVLEEVLVIIP